MCSVEFLEIECFSSSRCASSFLTHEKRFSLLSFVKPGWSTTGRVPVRAYARRIPSTGPSGFALFGAYCAAAVYGFYQIGQGNKHRRKVLDEKHNARAILVPFLQAEEDRRYVKDYRELKERENTVMKNVQGWNPEAKTYK